jgi:glycosyltransferase involved in cell wall biosynthesis
MIANSGKYSISTKRKVVTAVKPKVTVCICTCNRAEMLKGAIQSVLNQSYRDMKIVVLDECSTDGTKDVVLAFDDERLEYRCNEADLGMLGNFNRAIEVCDTEYLNIFHDDDRMFPWMIEKLVEVMETFQDVDLAGSSQFFRLDSGPIPPKISGIKGRLYRQNEFIEAVCARGNFIVMPSVMLRFSAIQKTNLRFRDVGPALDFYFWVEANSLGWSLYLLDCPLLEYRVHSQSTTSLTSAEHWWLSHENVVDFIANLNLDIDEENLRKHFAALMTVTLLSPYIVKLGKREISMREFKKQENELRTLGLSLPFKRRVIWFLKYVLCKRWLGFAAN